MQAQRSAAPPPKPSNATAVQRPPDDTVQVESPVLQQGESPIPPGHTDEDPAIPVIEENPGRYDLADLSKLNSTADLSHQVQICAPPGSKAVPIQPSTEAAHVVRIHAAWLPFGKHSID